MKYFEYRNYSAGESLFKIGDAPDFLAFVETGTVAVTTERVSLAADRPEWMPQFIRFRRQRREIAVKPVRVAAVGPAGVVGEFSFFAGTNRTYGADCTTPTQCFSLSRFDGGVAHVSRSSFVADSLEKPSQGKIRGNGAP
jgi:CRP-like cAMP-binding protein